MSWCFAMFTRYQAYIHPLIWLFVREWQQTLCPSTLLITKLEQKLSTCSQCHYDFQQRKRSDSSSKQICKNKPPSYFLPCAPAGFKEQHNTKQNNNKVLCGRKQAVRGHTLLDWRDPKPCPPEVNRSVGRAWHTMLCSWRGGKEGPEASALWQTGQVLILLTDPQGQHWGPAHHGSGNWHSLHVTPPRWLMSDRLKDTQC